MDVILYMRQPDGKIVKTTDAQTFAKWHADPKNTFLKKDTVGAAEISTVFLGVNHNFGPDGPPILFETMVFINGDMSGEYQERYATEDDAIEGHQRAIDMVKEELFPESEMYEDSFKVNAKTGLPQRIAELKTKLDSQMEERQQLMDTWEDDLRKEAIEEAMAGDNVTRITPLPAPKSELAWVNKYNIDWDFNTNRPKCFGFYQGTKQCTECKRKHECLTATDDDGSPNIFGGGEDEPW